MPARQSELPNHAHRDDSPDRSRNGQRMKILLAWELGSNWGHLATLLPLATRLRADGHRVLFAVRGLDGDLSPLRRCGFDYVPTPIAIAPLQTLHAAPVHGFADVLARCGFSNAQTLVQLIQAWGGLLHLFQPDAVVCKYAPLAEFATRNCPVLAIGTGFELPALQPSLSYFHEIKDQQAAAAHRQEEQILHAMQAAAHAGGFEKPGTPGQAFSHSSRLCLSWPALDHFGDRAGMDYAGPAESLPCELSLDDAIPPHLHGSELPATLAYLRKEPAWWKEFTKEAVHKYPRRQWLLIAPNLTLRQCGELCSPTITVVNTSVDWASPKSHIGKRFDSIICHGGHGIVSQGLAKGLRLLITPQHMEQLLLARRIMAALPDRRGIATMNTQIHPGTLMQELERLLKEPAPQAPAIFQKINPQQSIETIVSRIETIVEKARVSIDENCGIEHQAPNEDQFPSS